MSETALVTGARGFVGSWLARALLERGVRVVSIDSGRTERPVSSLRLLGIDDLVAARLQRRDEMAAEQARRAGHAHTRQGASPLSHRSLSSTASL